MGRPRKFKTPKALANNWDAYKDWCDSQEVLAHAFSAKNSEFVSEGLKRKITYTIEGFCVWAGISRSIFYDTYAADSRFSDIVTRAHGTHSRRGQGRGKIALSFFYNMPSIATNVTARQKKA